MTFVFEFRWLPELKELIQQLRDKVDNKIKPKKTSVGPTGKFYKY